MRDWATDRARQNLAALVGAGRSAIGRLSPARRGALTYVLAGLVFVSTDSLTKLLVSNVPVVHVVFGRHVSYLLAILVLAGGRDPRRLFATRRPWTQLARGVAMFGSTATFFLALSLLPIAEVSALSSTTPLIVIALARPVLGEQITRLAVAGAVIGFAGVAILVGIDPSKLNAAILVPLATALSLALYSMLTRALRAERADVTMFLSGLVGLAAAGFLEVVIPTTAAPDAGQWLAIGVVGIMALTGHRVLLAAFRWGRASDLAPLGYLSLVWSFLIGTFGFGEPLETRSVAGAIAIAAGGVATLRGAPKVEEDTPASVDYGGPIPPDRREPPDRTGGERAS